MLALLTAGLLAGPAQARSTDTPTITPRSGGERTTFKISFRAPYIGESWDGGYNLEEAHYRLIVFPPARCGKQPIQSQTRGNIEVGARVTFRAVPDKRGWCAGRYRGKVVWEAQYPETEEDCTIQPEAGSTMCDDEPTGRTTRERERIGAFTFVVH